jgi:UDP-N-acetyl-D-mannosaminuronic acid dehydrogenase
VQKEVWATDSFVTSDPALLSLNNFLSRIDIFILCMPHQAYTDLVLHDKIVVDIGTSGVAATRTGPP